MCGSKKDLCMDHDHNVSPAVLNAILCRRCNLMKGQCYESGAEMVRRGLNLLRIEQGLGPNPNETGRGPVFCDLCELIIPRNKAFHHFDGRVHRQRAGRFDSVRLQKQTKSQAYKTAAAERRRKLGVV